MTAGSVGGIRDEFDRLSAYATDWDWNAYYHPRLLRALPQHIGVLIDAGCGAGSFVRAVAPRCDRVVGIDVSTGMIARAEATGVPANVRLAVGDVLDADLPRGGFDAVVSIAALHHMDIEAALARFKELLRPGGTLAILDLYRLSGLGDRAIWMLGAALAPPVRWLHTGRLFPPREFREAWALHEVHDRYEMIPELRAVAADVLPGATVRRYLFWRYSLMWTKPSSSGDGARG